MAIYGFYSEFSYEKMVIFHSYVSLLEGIMSYHLCQLVETNAVPVDLSAWNPLRNPLLCDSVIVDS